MTKAQFLDIAERTAATAGEAGAAYLITVVGDLPTWWAPILMPPLALAKGWLAGYVGRKGTASALPAAADPASTALAGK